MTYYSIRECTTGQRDYYKTSCLLDYNYFKNYYKMIAIDLSKQQLIFNTSTKLKCCELWCLRKTAKLNVATKYSIWDKLQN